MKSRILAMSAIALLASHSARATTYFDNSAITPIGADGPISDGVTILGASFTAAAPDFSSIKLLLSASNTSDGGSVLVYLVPDNGTGASNGFAGSPTTENNMGAFTNFNGAQLVGDILDSSLSNSPTLASLWVNPAITTQNKEYWLELAPSNSSSVAWWYDGDASGTGVTNQAYINNYAAGNLIPASDSQGTYEFSVSTPEPATIALLGSSLAGMGFFRRRKPAKD